MAILSLYRPKDDRVIAGVCAGLARRFGVSSFLMRLIFIVLLILPPAAILPYLLLWVIMPSEGEPIDSP